MLPGAELASGAGAAAGRYFTGQEAQEWGWRENCIPNLEREP